IELPSLPDIAFKVHKAVEHEHVTIDDIAHIIEADPAIAAHLLKLANSPMNRTINPILSIRDAVMRLGINATRDYVLAFTIKDLFKTRSPLLKNIMKRFYTHSAQVAAMCMSIAQLQNTLKPESALLAGLLHDIGVIPILNYASKISSNSDVENEIISVIEKLKPLVGSMLLKQWGLDKLFICVVENAENWFRDDSKELDYGDPVVIAQLQNYIRPQVHGDLPELEEVPAFKKITLTSGDPECSNKILEIAHEELQEVMALLSN
ncbi:MAG: HDOD domain-containing protein, partial [Gammaproteobacteria bacterium]|nr:HDOD domain-containing protein [Gammaproteobacteria bacterium]